MDDKIIVVTGAASGIGLATVQLLLAQKAKVFGIDRSPRPDALQSQSDSHFAFHQVDIAESSAPAFSIAKCVEVFGPRIDGLLNVAGVIDGLQGADTITDGMWDRVIAVNLTAPVRLMREVIKFMKTQGSGAIVNVSSKAGLGGGAAGVAYTSRYVTFDFRPEPHSRFTFSFLFYLEYTKLLSFGVHCSLLPLKNVRGLITKLQYSS